MHPESILKFSDEKGFGELFWVICPVCWNLMKETRWEDGSVERACSACRRRIEALNRVKEDYFPL
jgi:hypothetical protein